MVECCESHVRGCHVWFIGNDNQGAEYCIQYTILCIEVTNVVYLYTGSVLCGGGGISLFLCISCAPT